MQHLLGFQCVGYVEIEEYCQKVIKQRQEDGFIDRAPIFTDIRAFVSDGYAASYAGLVDVITGGFPCQDISCAGKGAGITGERSGLWKEMAATVRIVRPRFCFLENSPMLTLRGLDVVLGDLAEMRYDAEWCVLGAVDAGAPHKRERIWIVAYANPIAGIEAVGSKQEVRPEQPIGSSKAGISIMADAMHPERRQDEQTGGHREQGNQTGRPQGTGELRECGEDGPDFERERDIPDSKVIHAQRLSERQGQEQPRGSSWRPTESGLDGMVDGLADFMDFAWPPEPAGVPRVATGIQNRVARLKAIGNGQVPQCAALAWRILNE